MKTLTFNEAGRGFGLVEVMVAMLIGMITVVVIMQVLAGAESHRRSVSSGSDAGIAAALGLQSLQRDLMNAGSGVALDANLYTTCGGVGGAVLGYNSARSTPGFTLASNVFVPVYINPPGMAVADPNTDIVQVTFAGSPTMVGRAIYVTDDAIVTGRFNVVPNPGNGLTTLTSGVFNGDLAVVSHGVVGNCILAQLGNPALSPSLNNVTTLPVANQIDRIAGVWNQALNFNRGEVFNAASLYVLGQPGRFVIRAYAVRNGRLTVCSPIYQNCANAGEWQPAAEGVVSLRAEYGVDANNDDRVETGEWTRTAPVLPLTWEDLKAIRIAMVARGKQFERAIVSTDCTPAWAGEDNATDDCPTGAPTAGQIVLNSAPDGANWAHYRYKAVQTTVSFRNLIWSNN